jgi:uncharacterized protein (TIGR03083 family)
VNESAKPAFERAAHFLVATTALVGPEQWERPGLGEWSVRDLVGHASRSLLTVETYLGHPAAAAEVATPVDYFLKALASIGDPARVAQRGREAGAALGLDPAGAIREIADRVLALVARTDEAQLVATPIGGMHLGVYLTTRTFELVVHTLDLATAINTPAQPPPEALAASLELAAGLALRSGRGAEALLALTGRRPLPPGFSVV